jgi:hypothetical protein
MKRHRRIGFAAAKLFTAEGAYAFIAGASSALNDMDFQRRSRNDSTPEVR